MAGSFPITPPASGTYPITIGFTTGQLASDANNTNDVANYAWKGVDSGPASARVATTGAETYTIASGSVTVINGTTIDGVSVAVNDVVLVKDAPASSGAGSALSSQPGNGLYYVTAVATNISVSRCATMSTASSQPNPAGRVVDVRKGGTVNGSTRWQVVNPFGVAAFTYGTTAIQWSSGFNAGSLEGVTIGSTTPSPQITANQLYTNQSQAASVFVNPWLYQNETVTGSISGFRTCNAFSLTDRVAGGTTDILCGIYLIDTVQSPATGNRIGVCGAVEVASAGTQIRKQAGYVGISGRAQADANIGGASGTPLGSYWGAASYGALVGGTYHDVLCGMEADVAAVSGTSVQTKIGVIIALSDNDAVRGSVDDIALCVVNNLTTPRSNTWKTGISFGRNVAGSASYQLWPFDTDSTIITASIAGSGTLPANIGIDFSTVTFSDAAFKAGAAPIHFAPMSSPPTPPSSGFLLYAASDGAHILTSTGVDTLIAGVV